MPKPTPANSGSMCEHVAVGKQTKPTFVCKCGDNALPYIIRQNRQRGTLFLACQNYNSPRASPICKPIDISLYDCGCSPEKGGQFKKPVTSAPTFAQRILASTAHINATAIFPPITHNGSDPMNVNGPIRTTTTTLQGSSGDRTAAEVEVETERPLVLPAASDVGFWSKSGAQKMKRAGAEWAYQAIQKSLDAFEMAGGSRKLDVGASCSPIVHQLPPSPSERDAILWFCAKLKSRGYEVPAEVRRGIHLERVPSEMASGSAAAAATTSSANVATFPPLDANNSVVKPTNVAALMWMPCKSQQTALEWVDSIDRVKCGYDFRFMLHDDYRWHNVKIVPAWRSGANDGETFNWFQLLDCLPNTAGWIAGSADWLLVCCGRGNNAKGGGHSYFEWLMVDAAALRRLIFDDLTKIQHMPVTQVMPITQRLTAHQFHQAPMPQNHSSTDGIMFHSPDAAATATSSTSPHPLAGLNTSSCPAPHISSCGTCAGTACMHLGVEIVPTNDAYRQAAMDDRLSWRGLFQKWQSPGAGTYLVCRAGSSLKKWWQMNRNPVPPPELQLSHPLQAHTTDWSVVHGIFSCDYDDSDDDLLIDMPGNIKKRMRGEEEGAILSAVCVEDDEDVDMLAPPNAKRVSSAAEALLTVYTDGSCFGNGRVDATAGCGVWFGKFDARNISLPLPHFTNKEKPTNNRAELYAILLALQHVLRLDSYGGTHYSDVDIWTDSTYCMDAINEIQHGGRGYATNRDITEPLCRLITQLGGRSRIHIRKVKAHSDIEGNEGADKLAKAGAAKYRQ